MSCDLCGVNTIKVTGNFPFNSKIVGRVMVPRVCYSKCPNCQDILVDFDQSIKISNHVKSLEAEAIKSIPIGEFISLNEAAEILGVTKQAFSKNPRIKRGLILSAKVGGRTVYWDKSVEEFRLTNDGRISVGPIKKELKSTALKGCVHSSNITQEKKASYNRLKIYALSPNTFTNCQFSQKKHKSSYSIQ